MKKIISTFLFVMIFAVFNVSGQDYDTTREADYLAVQAGLFDRHTLRAKKEDSQEIEKILQKIRKNHPEVKDINSWPAAEYTEINVGIKRGYVKDNIVITPEFMELTNRFNGVHDVWTRPSGGATVTIRFPQPLHLPSLYRSYNQLKAVEYAENNISVFYGIEVIAIEKTSQSWGITFNNAGLCMIIGCEKPKLFHFTVTKNMITKDWEREIK